MTITKAVTPDEILQNFILNTKRVLQKEELSSSDMTVINTVILLKDQFVDTAKVSNTFIDFRITNVIRNNEKRLVYELKIKLIDEITNTFTDAHNRVLVVAQGVDEERPNNTTLVCGIYDEKGVESLQWTEMMDETIQVLAVNDALNYLMFGIFPPKEEVNNVLH